MIAFLIAASLATALPGKTSEALAVCMAYLARAPEYAALSDAEISRNDGFFTAAAERYCSSGSGELWPLAHERAEAKLGLPADGFPPPEQQALAEQEIRSILREIWAENSGLRGRQVALPPEDLAEFMLSWLTDENQRHLLKRIEGPLQCAREAILRDSSLKVEVLTGGSSNPRFARIAVGCRYPQAQARLVEAMHKRFPDVPGALASSVVEAFMAQMTFWSLLTQ